MIEPAQAAAPALLAEVLRRFGTARLRVHGGSMRPSIRPGDVLHVRSAAAAEIATGDVVLFACGGRLFAHRVIGHTPEGGIRTRGDAHWRADPAVPASQVLGVVRAVERDGAELACRRARYVGGWRVSRGAARSSSD